MSLVGKSNKGATPAMLQYLQVKERYPDCILFFRMGDFYEMFFEDAVTAAPILGIALTTRDKNKEDAIPLCGFPYHSSEAYIAKIIARGLKVAICEQVEDPRNAKGVVSREVVRIITPGTATDSLTGNDNNFLLSISCVDGAFGYALIDMTTGDLFLGRAETAVELDEQVNDFRWNEAIIAEECGNVEINQGNRQVCISRYKQEDISQKDISPIRERFPQHFENRDVCEHKEAYLALLLALFYIRETQKEFVPHIRQASWHEPQSFLLLDDAAKVSLEIFQNLSGDKQGSLLKVIDHTVTPMGGRKLKMWLTNPLKDIATIRARQGAVGELKREHKDREKLRGILKSTGDVERLMGRITMGIANARDMINLKNSLMNLPEIRAIIDAFPHDQLLLTLKEDIKIHGDVTSLIEGAIADNPPLTVREGGIIKRGYDEQCDEIVRISREGKRWIATLEERERRRTGISSLKIGFNSVFGYYLEISKNQSNQAPAEYIRKQTLVNAERYINEELKKYEETVLGAEEKIREREYQLFCEVRNSIAQHVETIRATAAAIAALDCLAALAEVAERNGYVCPQVDDGGIIEIKDGRHPVVEKNNLEAFVPNDTFLDMEDNRLLLITGPNMAGKSTYIRQVALLVVLAQTGSFIPASGGRIGIVDRVFARIGAGDNIARGQSTFMVEMVEVANILKNATERSLIILDEVGRGTSTFDGMSIAWATSEYIHNRLGARTLFATHYHQLTNLVATLTGAKNYNVAVKEYGEKIIFLRKILEGGTNRSYGIQVARLAGIPEDVIKRAKEILAGIELNEMKMPGGQPDVSSSPRNVQMGLFCPQSDRIIDELKSLNVEAITPIDALNVLNRWRDLLSDS